MKDVPPRTSIVVKNIEAAWAACCIPGSNEYCATFKRTPETTMPPFTAQARFDGLRLDFGLVGWTTGFLAAFPCFVGGIGRW